MTAKVYQVHREDPRDMSVFRPALLMVLVFWVGFFMVAWRCAS